MLNFTRPSPTPLTPRYPPQRNCPPPSCAHDPIRESRWSQKVAWSVDFSTHTMGAICHCKDDRAFYGSPFFCVQVPTQPHTTHPNQLLPSAPTPLTPQPRLPVHSTYQHDPNSLHPTPPHLTLDPHHSAPVPALATSPHSTLHHPHHISHYPTSIH